MRQLYLLVGRVVSPAAILGLKVFTRLTRRPRVRVLVTNERGGVLLVRGVLSDGRWTLPGGGVGRRETLTAAARRELHEETGIAVDEADLVFIRTLGRPEVPISFEAPLFRTHAKRSQLPAKLYSPKEIAAAGWFAQDKLPEPLSDIAVVAIKSL